MSGIETLEELRRIVMDGVRKNAEGFSDPDDDWMAVAFFVTPKGIGVAGLPGDLFESEDVKSALGEMLRELVAGVGAIRYALLLNTFMAPPRKAEDFDPKVRVRELPGAYESLLLLLGDAEEEQVWLMRIDFKRNGVRVPTRWERMDDKGYTFSGRFRGLNEYMRIPHAGE